MNHRLQNNKHIEHITYVFYECKNYGLILQYEKITHSVEILIRQNWFEKSISFSNQSYLFDTFHDMVRVIIFQARTNYQTNSICSALMRPEVYNHSDLPPFRPASSCPPGRISGAFLWTKIYFINQTLDGQSFRMKSAA